MGTWDTWSEVKNMKTKKVIGDLEESQGTVKREFEDLIENSMPPIYRGLEHVSQLVGNLANRIYDLSEKLEEGCTCGGDCANERPEPTPMADEERMREEALCQAKLKGEEAYKDELRRKSDALRQEEALYHAEPVRKGEAARREKERCHDELVRKYEMLRRDEKTYGRFPY